MLRSSVGPRNQKAITGRFRYHTSPVRLDSLLGP